MKRTNTLACLGASLLLFGAACGEGETKASEVKTGETLSAKAPDLSTLSTGDLQKKFEELGGMITKEIATITDKASAMKASDVIGPLADQLKQLKEKLGASLPSMESVKTAIEGLKTKFAYDPDVMAALKPLLDKLQALLK